MKKFTTSYYLKQHQKKTGKKAPLPCLQCTHKFHRKNDLLVHEYEYHSNVRYICYVCKDCFDDSASLITHVVQDHDDEYSDTQCKFCGKSFEVARAVRNHIIKTHIGVNNSVCDVCGKKYPDAFKLKLHMQSHTGKKTEMCPVCGKGFSRRSNLKAHMHSHTGERPHTCPDCGKGFTQRTPLVLHMRLHTGDRPYICEICESSFISNNALNAHKKSKHNII